MPTGECPECGCMMHVRPLDVEEWHRRYPLYRAGDRLLPFKCPGCGFDLGPGCRVEVRSVPRELGSRLVRGALGRVTAVEGEAEARIYTVEVELQSGEPFQARFVRRELTWLGRG
jgi:hypothetical protein